MKVIEVVGILDISVSRYLSIFYYFNILFTDI